MVEPGLRIQFSYTHSSLFIFEKLAQAFHPNSAQDSFLFRNPGGIRKGTQSCCESPGFLQGLARIPVFEGHSPKLSLALSPRHAPSLLPAGMISHQLGRVDLDLGSHSQLHGFGPMEAPQLNYKSYCMDCRAGCF